MVGKNSKAGRAPGTARGTGKGAKRPLQLHLDGLMAGLAAIGKPVARSEAIALLARAAGLRNVHELERMAADGTLDPVAAVPLGAVDAADGTRMSAFRCGKVSFALDEAATAASRYVLCPTGGIVDLGSRDEPVRAPATGRTFHRTRVWVDVLSEEPIPGHMGVAAIMGEADTGGYVAGPMGMEGRILSVEEAAEALMEFGSEPDFFGIGHEGEGSDDDAFDAAGLTEALDRHERDHAKTIAGIVAGLEARGVPQGALDELVHEIADRMDSEEDGAPSEWASGVNNEGPARQVALILMEDGPIEGPRLIEESAADALADE